jgi:hypothetical protein
VNGASVAARLLAKAFGVCHREGGLFQNEDRSEIRFEGVIQSLVNEVNQSFVNGRRRDSGTIVLTVVHDFLNCGSLFLGSHATTTTISRSRYARLAVPPAAPLGSAISAPS